jgi:hypothetical protein
MNVPFHATSVSNLTSCRTCFKLAPISPLFVRRTSGSRGYHAAVVNINLRAEAEKISDCGKAIS